VKNATVDLPDILVEEEVEVMHDELKSALARQGITEEQYAAATGKTAEELHAEFRPGAEERAKTLLVLGEIASREGVDVPDRDIIDEIIRAKARYAGQPKLVEYFDTPRAQAAIRSSLRRSRVVEMLIDRWLTAHPEHPPIPHAEGEAPTASAAPSAEPDESAEPSVAPVTDAPAAAVEDAPADAEASPA
jgi:FKBP-type peptidyl-prolyl cis-trans isomerase (trigger factor)